MKKLIWTLAWLSPSDDGGVYLINTVFGGRMQGPVWPADK